MYKSHYDYIKNKDGNKLRLLFTVFGSLETKVLFIMAPNPPGPLFDTSPRPCLLSYTLSTID